MLAGESVAAIPARGCLTSRLPGRYCLSRSVNKGVWLGVSPARPRGSHDGDGFAAGARPPNGARTGESRVRWRRPRRAAADARRRDDGRRNGRWVARLSGYGDRHRVAPGHAARAGPRAVHRRDAGRRARNRLLGDHRGHDRRARGPARRLRAHRPEPPRDRHSGRRGRSCGRRRLARRRPRGHPGWLHVRRVLCRADSRRGLGRHARQHRRQRDDVRRRRPGHVRADAVQRRRWSSARRASRAARRRWRPGSVDVTVVHEADSSRSSSRTRTRTTTAPIRSRAASAAARSTARST